VGAKRVIWHVGFERHLRRRGPRCFEIRAEVSLSEEPLRIDYLLRKIASEGEAADHSAQTLRRLWPLLPRVSVTEYKSPGHPYRPGHLDRLWSYAHAYFGQQRSLPRKRADGTVLVPGDGGAAEVRAREDLCTVLFVPERTPSLDEDVESMGLSWEELSSGYFRVTGGLFALYIVELDVVGPAEGDDLLHSLGHGKLLTPEARWFWSELIGTKEANMSMQDMEGYDELMQKLLDAMPPEQRLAGLSSEQLLAGLSSERLSELVARLPPEVLEAAARKRSS
jgi:hypothetical protein